MRSILISIFAVMAAGVCLADPVTPSMEWQDVPPTATLGNVGEAAGFMSGQSVTNNFITKTNGTATDLFGISSSTNSRTSLVITSDGTFNVLRPSSGFIPFVMYSLSLPTKNGVLATLDDMPDLSGYVTTGPFTTVSNKVAEIEEAIDELLGGGGGGGDEPAYGDKKIAMFIVEVNPTMLMRHTTTNTANVIYTGFELKASTNNFDKASPLDVKLQFWSQSHSADTGVMDSDRMKLYMPVGNDPEWDMRSYKKFPNTLDIPKSQLASMVVLVDVSCLVRHSELGGRWLNEDNVDLVWAYTRDISGDRETYPGTNTEWWHPIAPVRWFSKLPNWAK